jgi:hypothetical protein
MRQPWGRRPVRGIVPRSRFVGDVHLSAERFPWTTQRGLGPSGQLLTDAVTYDTLKGHVADGGSLDEAPRGRWAELQIKKQDHARLTAN